METVESRGGGGWRSEECTRSVVAGAQWCAAYIMHRGAWRRARAMSASLKPDKEGGRLPARSQKPEAITSEYHNITRWQCGK
eukprot:scaffold7704_cov112-Isochrysis_galbana.AAC.17